MAKKLKKIIFFGTEDFSAEVLKSLIANGRYSIAAVVTKPDSRRGRGKKLGEPPVKQIAEKNGIAVWQPDKLIDITYNIKSVEDRLGILVSYGKIIPKIILDLFEPIGIINIHPSILPKYRGPSPVETAILDGDTEVGISFMKLAEKMDAGPVYKQSQINFNNNEGSVEIYKTVSKIASRELVEVLPKIIEGDLTAKPQNELEATYSKLIIKNDGIINWNKPAKQIEREIRAYQIWPKSRCTLGNVEFIVREAHLGEDIKNEKVGNAKITNNSLAFQTKQGSLVITRIQPLGKREMSIREFLAGYKDKI